MVNLETTMASAHSDNFEIQSSIRKYQVKFFNRGELVSRKWPIGIYIVDQNLKKVLKKFTSKHDVFWFKATEANKSVQGLTEILEFLQAVGANKSTPVTVLGGGVTQDTAGLACGLFHRGIDWHLVPTTTLSMMDSCIGGKLGVNLTRAKNQAGLFYPPKEVWIDFGFARSLKPEQFNDGIAEALKLYAIDHGYSKMEGFLDLPKEKWIPTCLRTKKKFIEADEFDGGARKILNFGHSIGHALETLTKNKVSHGYAIAVGMILESEVLIELGLISSLPGGASRQVLTDLYGKALSISLKYTAKQYIQAMASDKKRSGSKIDFVDTFNQPTKLVKVEMKDVEKALQKVLKRYKT